MPRIIKFLYKTILWIFFGVYTVIPVWHVINNTVSVYSLVFYLLSGYLCWRLILPYPFPRPNVKTSDITFLIAVIIFHLGSLALVSAIPVHFHFDEFIVANTSMKLPLFNNINWFGVFPNRWVAQFPILFYLLQKPFLLISPTVWSVRISTWPYSIGIILYLYWLTSTFIDKQFGRMAVLLHILFAPTIYINSMGLHFISSEFFYLASITHLILYLTTRNKSHLFPLSLYTTASYLTYTASYVTFPMVVLIGLPAVLLMKKHKIQTSFDLGRSLLVAFILFIPFLTFNVTRIPFLTQRTDEVNLFNGTWGNTKEQLKSGATYLTILTKQIVDAGKSLVFPNIGGHGGYDYGHMPLFHPFAICLLIAGLILTIFFLHGRQRRIGLAVLVITGIPFILGFILTIPPPPFHRITVIYPFFSLISALPVFMLYKYFIRTSVVKTHIFISVIIIFYGLFSLVQITAMIHRDQDIVTWDTPRISEYIKKHFPPKTTVYVAAEAFFHYQFELPFRLGKMYSIAVNDKLPMLKAYPGHGPLIIYQASAEENDLIRKRFPNLKLITSLDQFPLKDVELVVPGSVF